MAVRWPLPPRKDIQMNEIYEILDLIKIRPAMYIGDHSITALYSFLNGYSMALNRLSIEDHTATLLPLPFWFFHEYAARQYGYYESTSGWRNMILDQTNHDESQGLDAFFVMYEQFKSLKIVRYMYAVPDIKHQQFYEKEPLYPDPVKVHLVELTPGYLLLIETKEKYVLINSLYSNKQAPLDYAEQCFGSITKWKCKEISNLVFDKELEF